MSVFAAFFFISLAASAELNSPTCRLPVQCPCGKSGYNVTICSEELDLKRTCRRLETCKSCQDDLRECLDCPGGLEGPLCTSEKHSRWKRQYRTRSPNSNRSMDVVVPLPLHLLDDLCAFPGSIANGQSGFPNGEPTPEAATYTQDSKIRYMCNEGYALLGQAELVCGRGGLWSSEKPTCKKESRLSEVASRGKRSCEIPGDIMDGAFTAVLPDTGSQPTTEDDTEYPEGTRLLYFCDQDYALVGSSVLTCRSTGSWSSNPPFCSSDCGRSLVEGFTGTAVHRVLHGMKTVPGEWPWVVAIGVGADIDCGGSLLDSQTVLTAAHCLVSPDLTLYFGKVHRSVSKDDTEVETRKSTQLIRHPNYNSTTMDSDIGLIKFAPMVQFSDRIQPICPPSRETAARNLMTGRNGYVTGWGVTEHGVRAEELLMAQLPVLTNAACRQSYRKQGVSLTITRNMFCAGFQEGTQAACSGDSGSPLVFYNSISDRFTIEGLVSFGVEGGCGQPGKYTLFTKVLPYVPWILRNLS